MSDAAVLAGLGARLNREAGRPALPALFFFTDPTRTPDPVANARQLPRGSAVVYRHFGAADREATARRLVRLCRRRGLTLLIGADPKLARKVGADGVHWPERLTKVRPRRPGWLETGAAHSHRALVRSARAGLDAAVLSPVFPSRSASAGAALGAFRAGMLARQAGLPVIALGGVNAKTARRLLGRGFAGLAAVEGLSALAPRQGRERASLNFLETRT